MPLTPPAPRHYRVFLASPGDVAEERRLVREFFERWNSTVAQLWGVHFDVVDWETYATTGSGRPQELITRQTLERFKDSLVLFIGVMAQRFGSPTGEAESGTEEEFRWAIEHNRRHGSPEIKWFFKRIGRFVAPPDPEAIAEAAAQWGKVCAFREELKALPAYFQEYADADDFKETFEKDLSRWLSDRARPWVADAPAREAQGPADVSVPAAYYDTLESDFHRLDISGIDNDRAFEIPLSKIYVRLRVMFDEELQNEPGRVTDAEAIDIQTALLRYHKLVIVGDPGSGKSTFLKYVALMLGRSLRRNNPSIALEKLCIREPLPVPVFVSCWELSAFLRKRGEAHLGALLDFLAQRVARRGFRVGAAGLESLLDAGGCCLLFDGLDEVPTEAGRTVVSRLLEDCVGRFGRNRYVVTSRVRAYTDDTILKGEFARCDIQPFDANDRARFLKNWAALLFKTSPEQVTAEGTRAEREFRSLTEGIESNDRIRPLAINPLLLTVIAIVHWNRKRLPEQRVDLYDECVDVLLGQRREAEHVQSSRRADAFDERAERRQGGERPWVRKRFAEIAMRILEGDGNREEASKPEIVRLLAPRFLDRGAKTPEEAEIEAARFLSKQEVHSGLLVSRREQSYRFVHLTFQEYLAAWHLSNQEFGQVAAVVEPRLHDQRWFEPLQLLGGEWAKQSDEKLDRYLQWLLERQGASVEERARVVALCANIVRDTSGVAELTPETRKQFQSALEDTLDAFRPKSGISVLTQLEILEALGRLGAAVKSHLIDATKSGLNQVRSRAIEILLPHLSDDELFGMTHLLDDRSKEPIKTYLLSLLSRDPQRAAHWLSRQGRLPEKATDAFLEIAGEFAQKLPAALMSEVACSIFKSTDSAVRDYRWLYDTFKRGWGRLFGYVKDETFLRILVKDSPKHLLRVRALQRLIEWQGFTPQNLQFIRECITNDGDVAFRADLLRLLTETQKDDPQTWQLIRERVSSDRDRYVRDYTLDLLVAGRGDDPLTWQLVRERVTADDDDDVRLEALRLLLDRRGNDPLTLRLISEVATNDRGKVRGAAVSALLRHPLVREEAEALFPFHSGLPSYFDPSKPISRAAAQQYAMILELREIEVRRLFERLADKLLAHFGIRLELGWRDKPDE